MVIKVYLTYFILLVKPFDLIPKLRRLNKKMVSRHFAAAAIFNLPYQCTMAN